jgi:hypothetical protein
MEIGVVYLVALKLLEHPSSPPSLIIFCAPVYSIKFNGALNFVEDGRSRSLRKKQEKMWGAFHDLRTSENFLKGWNVFLRSMKVSASPTFFQHVHH